MKSTDWSAHFDGEVRHVWPEEDTFEHNIEDELGFCVCGPDIQEGDFGKIIIHNAFDGRATAMEVQR